MSEPRATRPDPGRAEPAAGPLFLAGIALGLVIAIVLAASVR